MRPLIQALRRAGGAALLALSLGVQAHGDEPHGDAPHPASQGPAVPRFETATEAFEVVGRLDAGALTLFVQRYASSEPVSQAQVEIEAGPHKAVARYDAAQGSYVLSDAALVKALSQPGEHALVLSVLAGSDADLLEARLQIQPPAAPSPGSALPWHTVAAALALAAGLAGLLRMMKRKRTRGARP